MWLGMVKITNKNLEAGLSKISALRPLFSKGDV